ncbi:phage holin family protein [Desulfocurvibacter africanus]|uniref:phage holin family protein n=1 Tax=Desulfocurvibacter africanus TaxID=873 RepID=UPI00040DB477|nr:phage holin family protein [Desulfocurvibacter africanus]
MIAGAWEWLERTWLVILLSILGGMARAAKCGERSIWSWACSCLVALFSGVVTHMLLSDFGGMSETVRVACASVSAYSGGVMLDAMQERLVSLADVIVGSAKRK